MAECKVSQTNVNVPAGGASPIPGFGIPSVLKQSPNKNGFNPPTAPEDIQGIFDQLSMILPSGTTKPNLSPNFTKEIFDGILKLLDVAMPFIMVYKFFLPLLNLLLCIIEVICGLIFGVGGPISKLFSQCIPEFLALFPQFALVAIILSLVKLIIQLVLYLKAQIEKIVNTILNNIKVIEKATQQGDAVAIASATRKIASLLCFFQGYFTLLSIVGALFKIFKEILDMAFRIPPCSDGNSGDVNSTCTPETCPAIIKNGNFTRTTGSLRYLNKVMYVTSIPIGDSSFAVELRPQTYQLYDLNQPTAQQFINIIDAYDSTAVTPKPVFYPSDGTYDASTTITQVPYLVDLRVWYIPAAFGRPGTQGRYIRFKDCSVIKTPSANLLNYDNSTTEIQSGVFIVAGGFGYEDDGVTKLYSYTDATKQATLENFLYKPISGSISQSDTTDFNGVEYTYKPNFNFLLKKMLITACCLPGVAANKSFVENTISADAIVKQQQLREITYPDPLATIECMNAIIDTYTQSISVESTATFYAGINACLDKLVEDSSISLKELIDISFDRYASEFTINPELQFTTGNINISVVLKDTYDNILTQNLPQDVSDYVAGKLEADISFGEISGFEYDGYQNFVSKISSPIAGTGDISMSYNNQQFATIQQPVDVTTEAPTVVPDIKEYEFVYSPNIEIGKPLRDGGDVARDGA